MKNIQNLGQDLDSDGELLGTETAYGTLLTLHSNPHLHLPMQSILLRAKQSMEKCSKVLNTLYDELVNLKADGKVQGVTPEPLTWESSS